MRRLLLIALPALTATSLSAQLTPEQRRAREFEAVRYTIGETRQLEEARLQEDYPLRGLVCGSASVTTTGCAAALSQALSGSRSLLAAMASAGGTLAHQHWVAFGAGPQGDRHLRALGDRPITLAVDRLTTMTLASPIGGRDRPLMIRAAVLDSAGGCLWSRMGEVEGNEQGRYIIPMPRLDPGSYLLQLAVYDVEVPETPYSSSTNKLDLH